MDQKKSAVVKKPVCTVTRELLLNDKKNPLGLMDLCPFCMEDGVEVRVARHESGKNVSPLSRYSTPVRVP
jgi:hypothetical protein